MSGHDALIARIEAVVFTSVRGRTGYDMGQVDDFLDGLVVALRQGRPIDALIDMVRFMPTRLREGYVMAEVDDFLAEVSALAQGKEPPAAEPVSPRSDPEPESYAAAPGVIEERRGLLARLFRR